MPTPYRLSLLRDNINTDLADNVDRLVDAQDLRENIIEVAESLFDIIGDTGRSYASTITKDGSTVGALSLNGSQLIQNGNLVIGTGVGSGAYLSINPGTSATAPIVLTSGTSTATARAGAIEYDGNNFYATISGPSRKTVLFTDRIVNTTSPLTGSGNLSSDLTLGIQVANGGQNGYLSNVDWTTFNSKLSSTPVGSSGQLIYNNGLSYAGMATSGFEMKSNKDQPSGYAGLNGDGNIVGPIILRTGTASGIDAITLPSGELAICTDTLELRIGNLTAGGEPPRYAEYVYAGSGIRPSGSSDDYLDWSTHTLRLKATAGNAQVTHTPDYEHYTGDLGACKVGAFVDTFLEAGIEITGPGSTGQCQILSNQIYLTDGASHTLYLNMIDGTVQLPGITQAARSGLTPSAGWLIYNSTANKFQGYNGSGWDNLN